jgi:hypothetical protein
MGALTSHYPMGLQGLLQEVFSNYMTNISHHYQPQKQANLTVMGAFLGMFFHASSMLQK